MQIQCLKHVPFEGPAEIASWADARGHRIGVTPLYEGGAPPAPDAFDWLLVMGGPMGVADESEYPWLAAEKRFIRSSIDAGKTVIGICLGAQLIAEVLGARVYRNPEKEIGWMPVELTNAAAQSRCFGSLPASLEVFHWHGDTFELPSGAVQLARSGACEQQAFVLDERVLGLQFHLESTPGSVSDIVAACVDELVDAPHIQSAETMLARPAEDYAEVHAALWSILDRLPPMSHR